MPDLRDPRPMTSFDPFQPALVRDPTNEAVWEWPAGVTPAQWQQGATWSVVADGSTALNWHGLLLEGWQPIDDTTPRLPLPDDCRP
jgi:hypothetical protein